MDSNFFNLSKRKRRDVLYELLTDESLEGLIKTALKNEQAVTKAIHKMVEITQKEKDHSTYAFLEWFVNEQVEEELNASTNIHLLEVVQDEKSAFEQ